MHSESSSPISKSVEDGLDLQKKSSLAEHSRLSHSEVDVWQGAHRTSNNSIASAAHGAHISSISHPRRGSLGQVSANGGSSSHVSDDDRWSWKGSFESALAMGSVV